MTFAESAAEGRRARCRRRRLDHVDQRRVGQEGVESDDGQFHSILDAALIAHLTGLIATEQNVGTVTYIIGGAAGSTHVGT